jgi:CheY-like chemotaxis protein
MILILEDDPDLRDIVAELLDGEGYEVATATDGVDALAQLARMADRDLPCFMLVDLGMPRMGGIEFRRAQRSDPRLKDIPIAFMSGARATAEALAELPAEHRADVLRKPIALDVLFAFIAARVRPSGVRRTATPSSAPGVEERVRTA